MQEQLVITLLPRSDRVWAGQLKHVSGVTAATAVEYRSMAHEMQAPVPVFSLYVPAAQAVQAEPP